MSVASNILLRGSASVAMERLVWASRSGAVKLAGARSVIPGDLVQGV